MSIVFTSLILLLVVALSGVVLRLLPVSPPLPLIQIVLGAVLATPLFGFHVEFDHELFFLLFIPPLLFADGWRIPKREFFLLRGPILTLALGLVFFTVLGLGYLVHWMIPVVPLAVAFALASVLAPTDAVAISSIAGNRGMPARLMHVLEGEALMNDASGLIALQFSITAALTGTFSLREASLRFVVVALGGLAIGIATTWLFSRLRRRVMHWSGDIDPPSQVALLLLLPFAAYLLAEEVLHVSGILAAVAAGMTIKYTDIFKGSQPAMRLQNNSVWSMLEFVFNGIIFLLLGLQLPAIISHADLDLRQAGGGPMWYLVGYVLAISLALVLMRFAWVWFCLQLVRLRTRLRRREVSRVSTRMLWVTALAGVRGAISLAAVLSVPHLMPDGSAFPARDLLIFLATGVILCTLLLGSFGLPPALKHVKVPESVDSYEEHLGRSRASQAAIKAVEHRVDDLERELGPQQAGLVQQVGLRIISDYRQRIEAIEGDQAQDQDRDEVARQARHRLALGRELRLLALRAERDELHRLNRGHEINDTVLRRLMREIDVDESSLSEQAFH